MASTVVYFAIFVLTFMSEIRGVLVLAIHNEECANFCDTKLEIKSSEICKRGCRFFTMISLVTSSSVDSSEQSCLSACSEAYGNNNESVKFCSTGCSLQKDLMTPRLNPHSDEFIDENFIDSSYPLNFVRQMYSNVFNEISSKVVVSWTYLTYSEKDGKGVLIEMNPKVYDMEPNTLNNLEDSLVFLDQSATADLIIPEFDEAKTLSNLEFKHYKESNFFNCIAKKTSLSRLLLSLTLLLSVLFLIWLSFNSIATATHHKIPANLSINGDLDYLKNYDQANKFSKEFLQEKYVREYKLCDEKLKIQII